MDRQTARMRKYGESKATRIMMATVPHDTSGLGLRKFQADGFLLTRVYILYAVKSPDVISNFHIHSKHWLYHFCIWCTVIERNVSK